MSTPTECLKACQLARDALTELEWLQMGLPLYHQSVCPLCNAEEPGPHRDDCHLARALIALNRVMSAAVQ